MHSLAIALSDHLGGLMIIGAAAAFYVASRAAGDALSRDEQPVTDAPPSSLRHALAQWGSIACVSVVAAWLDHPEIAVGVIFSTAVAALSLHLGVAVASGGVHAHRVAPVRAWAFVLPAAVLTMIIGLSGKLTLIHALLLATQGLLVVTVWREPPSRRSEADDLTPLSRSRRMQLVLAFMLSAVGAVAAVYGAVRMSADTKIMSTGLIASAALGPLLVLPMIGSASVLASQGHTQTAVGASVIVVFLNLCLLLPLSVALWHVREQLVQPPLVEATTTQPATTQAVANDQFDVDPLPTMDDMPRVMSFPIAVWRIDTVLLILLGLMLLPVSLGLWEIRRSEGLLLIVIYACYLVATTFLGRRW